ncbi:hypothetical protein BGX33_006128 [Mortierella sp. NVP41]|nr:hypothetical protein BGX33_006128 [Mortierella sp. NVP41]
MDTLIYPPAAPIPLILPRSLSFQAGCISDLKGSSRARKTSFTTEPSSSPPSFSPLDSLNPPTTLRRQSTFTFPASTSLPATYTFAPASSPTATMTLVRSQTRRQRRRHTITGGGFIWTTTTTLPPRHALHMPIMKISPLVRRREEHQRNIHRLMHEGREEEVMRRRGIATVMDTSEEDEDEIGMAGVIYTGASNPQQQQLQQQQHLPQQQQQAYAHYRQQQQQAQIAFQQQRQAQLQQQKQLLLIQQQQQQRHRQQMLSKQCGHLLTPPALNTTAATQVRFSDQQQKQPQVQVQTPQQRGANAINMVGAGNLNTPTNTASTWNYNSQHAASTGRLSLY